MTTLNIEEIKTKIQDLHDKGLSSDEILSTLKLPYDIENAVSPTNQRLLQSRAEEGCSEEELKSIAELIALLRSWKQDEALQSKLSEADYKFYTSLKSEYNQLTTKDIIIEADRKRLKEISFEIEKTLLTSPHHPAIPRG